MSRSSLTHEAELSFRRKDGRWACDDVEEEAEEEEELVVVVVDGVSGRKQTAEKLGRDNKVEKWGSNGRDTKEEEEEEKVVEEELEWFVEDLPGLSGELMAGGRSQKVLECGKGVVNKAATVNRFSTSGGMDERQKVRRKDKMQEQQRRCQRQFSNQKQQKDQQNYGQESLADTRQMSKERRFGKRKKVRTARR